MGPTCSCCSAVPHTCRLPRASRVGTVAGASPHEVHLLPLQRRTPRVPPATCRAPHVGTVAGALPHEVHLLVERLGVAVLLALLADAVEAGLQREGPLDPRGEAH